MKSPNASENPIEKNDSKASPFQWRQTEVEQNDLVYELNQGANLKQGILDPKNKTQNINLQLIIESSEKAFAKTKRHNKQSAF